MADPGTAFLLALGIVFVAEFADKTQFAILALAGRGHPWRVFAGASLAFAVLSLAAAWVGDLIGARLPLQWVAVAAGAVFIVLGILGMRDHDDDDGPRRKPGFVAAFTLILLAEFGDRTQIAVVALAARNGHPWLTGLGAAIALAATAAIAVLAGKALQDRIPARRVARASSVLFILVGVSFLTAPWWPW